MIVNLLILGALSVLEAMWNTVAWTWSSFPNRSACLCYRLLKPINWAMCPSLVLSGSLMFYPMEQMEATNNIWCRPMFIWNCLSFISELGTITAPLCGATQAAYMHRANEYSSKSWGRKISYDGLVHEKNTAY